MNKMLEGNVYIRCMYTVCGCGCVCVHMHIDSNITLLQYLESGKD